MESNAKDASYAVNGYVDDDSPSIVNLPYDPYASANEPKNDLNAKREEERCQAGQAQTEYMLNGILRSCARSAKFSRLADWMHYLGVSRRDREVLAKIYSFQTSYNKGQSEQSFHMSLSTMGKVLHVDRANIQKTLKNLLDSGMIVKESNGARKPATYRLDERRCMLIAICNGYEQPDLTITKAQAEELLRRDSASISENTNRI